MRVNVKAIVHRRLLPQTVCDDKVRCFLYRLCLTTLFVASSGDISNLQEDPSGHAADLDSLRPVVWSDDLTRWSCELPAGSGRATGVCLDSASDISSQIHFCKDVVKYRACVPAQQPLWPSWNATKKDFELANLYKALVEARLAKEMNVTPDTFVEVHLLSNPECFVALKNALCWHNFPKCSDSNVSLPLCQTSCNQFYAACKYQTSFTSLNPACSDNQVASNGLFNSGSPGRDQILAQDTVTCDSTRDISALYVEDVVSDTIWLLTPPGLAIIGLIVVIIFAAAYILLVPYGFRTYVWWSIRQFMMLPWHIFQKLPPLEGRTILVLFSLAAVAAVAVGIFWMRRQGMGIRDRYGLSTSSARDQGKTFIPHIASYDESVAKTLTTRQMRQVIGSCSCTGDGVRRASPGYLPGTTLLIVLALQPSTVSGRTGR